MGVRLPPFAPPSTRAVLSSRNLFLIAVIGLGLFSLFRATWPGHGSDFFLYCAGVRVADAGGNPYDVAALRSAGDSSGLPITNPPIIFPAMRPLCAAGSYIAAWLAVAVLTLFIVGVLDRSRDWLLLVAVVAAGFEALGWMVHTGNIAPFEMLLVAVAVIACDQRRLMPFGTLLGAATFLKLLPGVFAVVPLVTARTHDRLRAFAAIAAVAGSFVLLHVFLLAAMPDLARHYWEWMFGNLRGHVGAEAVSGGVAHPSVLSLLSDASASVSGRSWPALPLFVLFCAGMAYDLFRRPRSIAAWCLGLLAMFPRLKPYSFGVALVPLYLGAKALPPRRQMRLLLAACVVPIVLNGLSGPRVFGYGQLFGLLAAYLIVREEIYSSPGERQRP